MRRLIAKGFRDSFGRSAICVTGIAVSTLLVLVLLASYRSVIGGVTKFLRRPGCDVWIAPRGTKNLVRSSGSMPAEAIDRIRHVRGVRRVDPIVLAFVTAEANGERLTLLGIAFMTKHSMVAPAVVAGKLPRGLAEIALDRAAAYHLHVRNGDDVTINGQLRRVVGLTSGTNLLATQFVFGDFSSARFAPDPSFVIAELDSPAAESRIRTSFPEFEVMSGSVFEANSTREIGAGFIPVLALITTLGVASASLLVSFLINGVIDRHRGELAVLLAAGVTPAAIGGGIAMHAAQLLALGISSGALLAHLLAWCIDALAPVIPLENSAADFVAVASVLCVTGLITAIIPLLRLKDVDPLEAFRA